MCNCFSQSLVANKNWNSNIGLGDSKTQTWKSYPLIQVKCLVPSSAKGTIPISCYFLDKRSIICCGSTDSGLQKLVWPPVKAGPQAPCVCTHTCVHTHIERTDEVGKCGPLASKAESQHKVKTWGTRQHSYFQAFFVLFNCVRKEPDAPVMGKLEWQAGTFLDCHRIRDFQSQFLKAIESATVSSWTWRRKNKKIPHKPFSRIFKAHSLLRKKQTQRAFNTKSPKFQRRVWTSEKQGESESTS